MLKTKERLITYDEAVEFDLWGSGEVASRYRFVAFLLAPSTRHKLKLFLSFLQTFSALGLQLRFFGS